jgi:hypothetical protein
MQTDNTTLLDNVQRTLELAVSPDLTDEQRHDYLEKGTALRSRLMTLLTANFNDGTQEVLNANAEIKQVNAKLKQKLKDLQGVAETVGALASLVSTLDDLFKLPFAFK